MGWLGSKQQGRGEEGSPPRVSFTPAARQKLLELLAPEGPNGGAALRLSVKNPGAGAPSYDMALEPTGLPMPGDAVIDGGGFRVLVDRQSLPETAGATVDFADDPLRPGFRVEAPRPELPAVPGLDSKDPLVDRVRAVIDQRVNPAIASHGGRAQLVGLEDGVAFVVLGGGCQGCSMASLTLRQGVEQMIKQAVPQIRAVADVTDHARGSNPYFSSAKG